MAKFVVNLPLTSSLHHVFSNFLLFFISHHRSQNVIVLAMLFASSFPHNALFTPVRCRCHCRSLYLSRWYMRLDNSKTLLVELLVWQWCFFVALLLFTYWHFVVSFSTTFVHFIIVISFDGMIFVDVCHLFYFIHFHCAVYVSFTRSFVRLLAWDMNEFPEFPAFNADLT